MSPTIQSRDALPPTPPPMLKLWWSGRLGRTCRRVHSRASAWRLPFEPDSSRDSRSRFAFATLNVLTTMSGYDSVLPTTPSTPIHDAHQEGYSFIEVACRLIHSGRSYQ